MLFPHMHVSSSIGRVLLPAVVEAGKLFLELLGAPSHVLLSRRFSLTDLRSQVVLHFQILNYTSNEFVLGLCDEVGGKSLSERALQLASIDLLVSPSLAVKRI